LRVRPGLGAVHIVQNGLSYSGHVLGENVKGILEAVAVSLQVLPSFAFCKGLAAKIINDPVMVSDGGLQAVIRLAQGQRLAAGEVENGSLGLGVIHGHSFAVSAGGVAAWSDVGAKGVSGAEAVGVEKVQGGATWGWAVAE
jgi:hypothetical protein